jgi:hypothetical protein
MLSSNRSIAWFLVTALTAALAVFIISCTSTAPAAQPVSLTAQADSQSRQTAAAADIQPTPAPNPALASDNRTEAARGPDVQIMLVHYRGTLSRIGCCNPGQYERNEFVVIQNRGDMPQDINNWSLTNITRGYPTFYFPSHYPCVPYFLQPVCEEPASESNYKPVLNPAVSEYNTFLAEPLEKKPVNTAPDEMKWESCTPTSPPDQTPMKPAKGGQGISLPCVLYPGQTILVFTDETHCSSGGFSFNWGFGNIWNNEIPDTAVLYNDKNEEVSRRSYMTGR